MTRVKAKQRHQYRTLVKMTLVTERYHGVLHSYQDRNCATICVDTLVSPLWGTLSYFRAGKSIYRQLSFYKDNRTLFIGIRPLGPLE